MYKTLDVFFQKISLFFHNMFGVTPNGLSYSRIFAAPWLMLLIIETLNTKSITLGIVTVVGYTLIVATDALDGPLARALAKQPDILHNAEKGGVLDRISDKLLIVFGLIPFGINIVFRYFTKIPIKGETAKTPIMLNIVWNKASFIV